jgi:hypothetical protein
MWMDERAMKSENNRPTRTLNENRLVEFKLTKESKKRERESDELEALLLLPFQLSNNDA